MRNWRRGYKIAVVAAFLFWLAGPLGVGAKELEAVCEKEGAGALEQLTDGNYSTGCKFVSGDVIKVTAGQGEEIAGIYVIWDSPVKEWTLEAGSDRILCGQEGFLHEYVPLKEAGTEVSLHIQGDVRISDIYLLGEGELPDWVQVWQPPCEKADIMLVSSHADDEILFFGGIIPTYYKKDGATVQVVYMTEYWTGQRVREHEKLDGLWASGLDIYPVCGNFRDVYAEDLEQARQVYDEQAMREYLIEQLEHFKPQVVVSHDVKGEYGHGFHMLTSQVVQDAVEAAEYQVPKTYLHLYKENELRLDLRIPLDAFGGRTALEVASEAYKQHKSQQWCWFYVSDDYKYSCAEFGLFRSTVGPDSVDEDGRGDMLENIVTYARQARLEAQRLEAERLEAERLKAEQEARLQKVKLEQLKEEAHRQEMQRRELLEAKQQEAERLAYRRKLLGVCLGAAGICLAVSVVAILWISGKRKGRKR